MSPQDRLMNMCFRAAVPQGRSSLETLPESFPEGRASQEIVLTLPHVGLVPVCLREVTQASRCHESCRADMFDHPPWFGENALEKLVWLALQGEQQPQAYVAPDAFCIACMIRPSVAVDQDRFEDPERCQKPWQ